MPSFRADRDPLEWRPICAENIQYNLNLILTCGMRKEGQKSHIGMNTTAKHRGGNRLLIIVN